MVHPLLKIHFTLSDIGNALTSFHNTFSKHQSLTTPTSGDFDVTQTTTKKPELTYVNHIH